MGVDSAYGNLPVAIKAIATLLKDLLPCYQMYWNVIFSEDIPRAPFAVKPIVALHDR